MKGSDETPFARDSLETLAKKLRQASDGVRHAAITTGQILLAARLKFGLPASDARGRRHLAEFAEFKAWCFKHSGVTWKVCQKYMAAARNPEGYEHMMRRAYAQRDHHKTTRANVLSSEQRIRITLGWLVILTPAERAECLRRLSQRLEIREAA